MMGDKYLLTDEEMQQAILKYLELPMGAAIAKAQVEKIRRLQAEERAELETDLNKPTKEKIKILAETLLAVLVKDGVMRKDCEVNPPELIMAAETYIEVQAGQTPEIREELDKIIEAVGGVCYQCSYLKEHGIKACAAKPCCYGMEEIIDNIFAAIQPLIDQARKEIIKDVRELIKRNDWSTCRDGSYTIPKAVIDIELAQMEHTFKDYMNDQSSKSLKDGE